MNTSLICLLIRLTPEIGGAERDRTADLLRARQALSQLSYSPNYPLASACFDFLSIAKADLRPSNLSLLSAQIGGSGQTRTADLTLIRGAL